MSVTKVQTIANLTPSFEVLKIEEVAYVNPRADKSAISDDLLVSLATSDQVFLPLLFK